MASEKAQKLISYITVKYGLIHLGQIRALASIPEFRRKAAVGFDMLSFEKVLRSNHGVVLSRRGSGLVRYQSGNEVVELSDDNFGSVVGAIQTRLRKAYPEYARYRPTPIVQMGHGVDVVAVMRDFDHNAFGRDVVGPYAAAADDDQRADIDQYWADAAMVNAAEGASDLALYGLFESTHRLLVNMRLRGVEGIAFTAAGDVLPFAEGHELGDLFSGLLKRSYRARVPIPSAVVSMLEGFYGVGELRDDGKEYVYRQFNPYSLVGSTYVELPGIERSNVITEPVANQEEQPDDRTTGPNVGDDDPDAIERAIAHLERYYKKPLSKMSAEERIRAQFGTERGSKVWEGMSRGNQQKFGRSFGFDEHTPQEWFGMGAAFLAQNIDTTETQETLLLLVAGRTYAYGAAVKVNLQSAPPTIRKIQ